MKIHVHCDDRAPSPVKRQAAEAVIRSLRRVKWVVESVRVHFNAIGALAGGADKRCRIQVQVRDAALVSISGAARSWKGALDAVAVRIRGRVVARIHPELPTSVAAREASGVQPALVGPSHFLSNPLLRRNSAVDLRGGGNRTRPNATSVAFSLGKGSL